MPSDDTDSKKAGGLDQSRRDTAPPPSDTSPTAHSGTSNSSRSLFSVPAPIKALFDRFPLQTYPSNRLPVRSPSPSSRQQHILAVFTTEQDAARGAPSFNPTCAKWQAFLRISGVDFTTRPSNNHASPSGALPFLMPKHSAGEAVAAGKLEAWVQQHGPKKHKNKMSEERVQADLMLSLLNPIRLAYLHALYLTPTFLSKAQPLYIDSATHSTMLRAALAYPLRAAAFAEVTGTSHATTSQVDEEDLYGQAEEALGALSTSLGQREWFESNGAGIVDAGVFGYTNAILSVLDEETGVQAGRLAAAVSRFDNLVEHRNRLLDLYFT